MQTKKPDFTTFLLVIRFHTIKQLNVQISSKSKLQIFLELSQDNSFEPKRYGVYLHAVLNLLNESE